MFTDILAAMPFPALVVSSSERIESISEGGRALLGADGVGRHYATLLRQPLILDAVETALKENRATTARYLTTEARRDETWVATVSPIGATGAVLVTFEDKTDKEEAGTQRRDFVANVSHELRTPLTALLGFIETLQGAAKDDPAAQARFLSIMEREALRMNRLVHDLLSLNRVESEKRVRPRETVDLAAQVRSAMHTLERLADECGVTLASEGVDAPVPMLGDADQLSQVATNLLENAIKYSGAGTTATVSITREDDNAVIRGPAVVLTVRDTGEGIDPIHIPRLTERFYRIDTHRSREQGGTGLGLAIVKHIVDRHRGRLRIESAVGEGSAFRVIFPADQPVAIPDAR